MVSLQLIELQTYYKVRHWDRAIQWLIECRTFGALAVFMPSPGLTAGPIYCRPFGPGAVNQPHFKSQFGQA
jgi:hypothetical protein